MAYTLKSIHFFIFDLPKQMLQRRVSSSYTSVGILHKNLDAACLAKQ
jgi:hypothetical protein